MSKFKLLYVYILKCSDESYYTGITNNLEKRVIQHNEGANKECYTFPRRPLKLLYYEMFTDFNLGILWEKRIKNWSRKKKEALIASDWKGLKDASVCRNKTNYKDQKE